MFSLKFAANIDPARIAAQIVSGVGFLGTGAILRDHGRVVGLTTAAMIWLAAALGMGVGSGHYFLASVGAGVTLVVLWAFPRFEHWIDNVRHTDAYEVVCAHTPGRYEELLTLVQQARLQVITSKVNENLIVTWVLRGTPSAHAVLSAHLLDDPDIKEFCH